MKHTYALQTCSCMIMYYYCHLNMECCYSLNLFQGLMDYVTSSKLKTSHITCLFSVSQSGVQSLPQSNSKQETMLPSWDLRKQTLKQSVRCLLVNSSGLVPMKWRQCRKDSAVVTQQCNGDKVSLGIYELLIYQNNQLQTTLATKILKIHLSTVKTNNLKISKLFLVRKKRQNRYQVGKYQVLPQYARKKIPASTKVNDYTHCMYWKLIRNNNKTKFKYTQLHIKKYTLLQSKETLQWK